MAFPHRKIARSHPFSLRGYTEPRYTPGPPQGLFLSWSGAGQCFQRAWLLLGPKT